MDIKNIRWQSYNCFSSAVGSLLTYYRMPWISSVLDSSCDFYYQPIFTLGKREVGVWPGPEHPVIQERMRLFYGLEIRDYEHKCWQDALKLIEHHLADGGLVFAAVENYSCPYIPMRNAVGRDWHYLIILRRNTNNIYYYDSFFDKTGYMTLSQLQNSMRFTLGDGQTVFNRVYIVHNTFSELIPKDVLSSVEWYQTCIHKVDPYNSITAKLLSERINILFGPLAIRLLADNLAYSKNTQCSRRLLLLSQCFKDVHYQRVFFLRFLKEMKVAYRQVSPNIDKVMGEVVLSTKKWFRAKTFALYASHKEHNMFNDYLSKILLEIADIEERLLVNLAYILGSL